MRGCGKHTQGFKIQEGPKKAPNQIKNSSQAPNLQNGYLLQLFPLPAQDESQQLCIQEADPKGDHDRFYSQFGMLPSLPRTGMCVRRGRTHP